MSYLITGAAGFIGYHVSRALLERGEIVVGLDNLSDYYDPKLKLDRLAQIRSHANFDFLQVDIADHRALDEALAGQHFSHVIHLAAQAGVRYSIDNPRVYIQANVVGHLNILEFCRNHDGLKHLVFASSSSVYGGNTKQPFSESDPVNKPVSLYAATKRADELISYTYAHIYRIPQTGLRFFTVYGPWGRPDMAYWSFTESILKGDPIRIFNNGDMLRDFTYIDDIVAGVVAAADTPPPLDEQVPFRCYNIGNNRPEPLMKLVSTLEEAIGRKAKIVLLPMQQGDVKETYADIDRIRADLGFQPTTGLDEGIQRFVSWYCDYSGSRKVTSTY